MVALLMPTLMPCTERFPSERVSAKACSREFFKAAFAGRFGQFLHARAPACATQPIGSDFPHAGRNFRTLLLTCTKHPGQMQNLHKAAFVAKVSLPRITRLRLRNKVIRKQLSSAFRLVAPKMRLNRSMKSHTQVR